MKAEAFASAHSYRDGNHQVTIVAAMKAEAFASAHQSGGTLGLLAEAGRNEGGGFRLRAQQPYQGTAVNVWQAAMKAEAFASAHQHNALRGDPGDLAAMKAEAFASAHWCG